MNKFYLKKKKTFAFKHYTRTKTVFYNILYPCCYILTIKNYVKIMEKFCYICDGKHDYIHSNFIFRNNFYIIWIGIWIKWNLWNEIQNQTYVSFNGTPPIDIWCAIELVYILIWIKFIYVFHLCVMGIIVKYIKSIQVKHYFILFSFFKFKNKWILYVL